MYCSNCGKELLENAKFCGSCGTKIGELSPPPAHSQTVNEPLNSPAPSQAFNEGKILMETMSSALGFLSNVDGKIILSENTLIFKPYFYQVFAKKITIPLIDIVSIIKETYMVVFNRKMKIYLRSGVSHEFLVQKGRDEFINALEQQIRIVGGSCTVLG